MTLIFTNPNPRDAGSLFCHFYFEVNFVDAAIAEVHFGIEGESLWTAL